MLRIFPLLLVSVVVYNLLAFGHGFASHDAMQAFLTQSSFNFHMFSGDVWSVTIGDLLILLTLGLLFFEIVKSTRTSRRELLNHGLSAIVFVIALVEFIVMKGFSTSTFFFIVAMTAFDVVGGYSISIAAAEHNIGLGKAGVD
ncbi:MAG TPA: hypothetical protein VII49_04640 [Rhizomicrobium sp.]